MNSPRTLVGLVGAGGFGREVMPLLQAAVSRLQEAESVQACFVDRDPRTDRLNGVAVLTEAAFLASDVTSKLFNVAISDSRRREALVRRLTDAGLSPLSIVSPRSEVIEPAEIGEGLILCAFATISANTRVGRYFHGNLYSYVAHDCQVGDFVTFAPRATCSGRVVVGDHVFVGAGAVVRQGSQETPLTIGEGAVIGMGAVVTKDVPPGVTVVGNPARPLASS